MAAKRTSRKKATARKTGTRAQPKGGSALARIERELPPTLRQFSKRVRRGLTRIEREVELTEARYRRRATRALRDVSHQLGRFEAEGERRWRRLTTRARRDALRTLRRAEKALQPKPAKKAGARSTASRGGARRR